MRTLLQIFLLIMVGVEVSAQPVVCTSPERRAYFQRVMDRQTQYAPRLASVARYDVHFYDCYWEINPYVRAIKGSVSIHFNVKESLQLFSVDLSTELLVDSVIYHGQPLSFTHNSDVVEIQLPNILAEGQRDSIRIYYEGTPPNTGWGSFTQRYHSGKPALWTLSEPYGAMDWWPSKNDLTDKADSIQLTFVHPDTFSVASNGVLQFQQPLPDGKMMTQWKHRYPIAAYLVSFAITNYQVLHHSASLRQRDLPMVTYCYPEHVSFFEDAIHEVLGQLVYFDEQLGGYPFINEQYGHAQFGWGGGMEHQTMSFLGSLDETLVAHELVHQWFGNQVTCGSWVDIWLNEGFASHFSYYWMEVQYPENALSTRRALINNITSQVGGSVKVDDTTNVDRIFDSRLTYYKGGYLVYMLRYILGEEDFFQGLKNYLNDPQLKYGFARTPDLKRHLEAVSGRDLTDFFRQWYEGEGYPSYQIEWSKYGTRGIRLEVKQTSSHPSVSFYKMKIPVLVKNATQEKIFHLEHDYSGQAFVLDVGFEVDSVLFDPELWILSKNNIVTYSEYTPNGDPSVVMYPNPSSNHLNIRLENFKSNQVELRIINSVGQRIFKKKMRLVQGADWERLNISTLSSGMYIVEIVDGDHKIRQKLIKQ